MSIPYETGPIALYATAVADTNGVVVDCLGLSTICVQLAGTMANSSTVYFEGNVDETNWIGVLGWNRTTGVKALTTTSTGLYVISVSGLSQFRARFDFQAGTSSLTATAKGTSLPTTTLVTAS